MGNGFVKFEGKSRAGRKPGKAASKNIDGEARPERVWVKIYPNGSPPNQMSSVVLVFSTEAVRTFGLKRGDTADLYFDENKRRVGILIPKKKGAGSKTFSQHGTNESVLKLSMTALYREHLSKIVKEAKLPWRTPEPPKARERKDGSTMITFDLPQKRVRAKASDSAEVEPAKPAKKKRVRTKKEKDSASAEVASV